MEPVGIAAIDAAGLVLGMGRALMQGALAVAVGKGATPCALQVAPGNRIARALYLSLGFADLYRYTYWTPP